MNYKGTMEKINNMDNNGELEKISLNISRHSNLDVPL